MKKPWRRDQGFLGKGPLIVRGLPCLGGLLTEGRF